MKKTYNLKDFKSRENQNFEDKIFGEKVKNEKKERKEMKMYVSITLHVNPHPPCHYFKIFWLPSFSSPIAPNLYVAVTLRFFSFPDEVRGGGGVLECISH